MTGVTQAVFMNQRSFVAPTGQQEYTSVGTYSWVCPAGVTSVSVVSVGAGSTGASESYGGGGGGLGYKNNISVTPGNSYTVVVGSVGSPTEYYANGSSISGFNGTGEYRVYVNQSLANTYYDAGTSSGSVSGVNKFSEIQDLIFANTGRLVKVGPQKADTGTVQFYSILTSSGDSYFSTRTTVTGGGAYSTYAVQASRGGSYSGDGGGNGGNNYGGAAGGAGGYSGNGGAGTAAGNGGGGGGGSYSGLDGHGAGGGGVGILGQGSSGTAGTPSNAVTFDQTMYGGGGGSGGSAGGNTTSTDSGYSPRNGGNGGAYGGGGGSSWNGTDGVGATGAVRIIWPGTTRSFPSTNTGNL